jgi:hypothetical protein
VLDIQFELPQYSYMTVQGYQEKQITTYGLLGGLGTLQNLSSIKTEVTDPIWIPDEGKADKGRWRETTSYSTNLTFSCPTTTKIHQYFVLRLVFPISGKLID